MLAAAERTAFGDGLEPAVEVEIEGLADHGGSLGGGDHGEFGVTEHQVLNEGAVVGFHVVDHEVVEFAACENALDILKELLGNGGIGGVQEHGLLVEEQIAVVGSSARDGVDIFEKSEFAVAGTYIIEVVVDFT